MSLPFRASVYRTWHAFQSQLARVLEGILLCIAILMIATQTSGEPNRGRELPPRGRAVGAPASAASAKAEKKAQASDRVLVRFKKSASRSQRDLALAHAGVSVRKHFRHSGVSVLHIPDKAQSVEKTIERLVASGAVEYAVPDQLLYAFDTFPNDPSFASLYGLHNTGQTGGVADADIDAPEAWDVTTGDRSIVVGVIDTGVDYTHPDLAANMWRNPGEIAGNNLDDDRNGYVDDLYGIDAINDDSDPFDDAGHGTHVAGTIGARGNNASGVVGVNWRVGIMALKFLGAGGGGLTSDAIECLEYATRMKTEHGVNLKLTSNSWGGGAFNPALRDAIAASGNAGILFVAAAGNGYGNDNDAFPTYPASYDVANVLAVAATDHADGLAYFSNVGRTSVDLGAPGVDVLSTVPGNSYDSYSGTSMATPHVSGAAALVWAAFPDMPVRQMKLLLMGTGDPTPALAGGTVSGNRLNVANALNCEDLVSLSLEPAEGFRVRLRERMNVEVDVSDCGAPAVDARVSITTPDGVMTARDDGATPDETADDGRYTARWRPRSLGSATLVANAVYAGQALSASADGTVTDEPFYSRQQKLFSWIDATAGTRLGLYGDDESIEIPIGFPFRFEDEVRETVKVSTNGYLSFGDEAWQYQNQPIPSLAQPNAVIAPYWDDLNPEDGGGIYFLLEGQAPKRRLTIEWHQVPYFADPSSTVTFEVTLFESGRTSFQYLDVESGLSGLGASATVGIESSSGGSGLQISFDEPSVQDETALWIRKVELRSR